MDYFHECVIVCSNQLKSSWFSSLRPIKYINDVLIFFVSYYTKCRYYLSKIECLSWMWKKEQENVYVVVFICRCC